MTPTQAVERRIAARLVDDALEGGYEVTVFDGECTALSRSREREDILGAMFSTESDRLVFRKDGKRRGTVDLVYGNGRDVLSDWSDNQEINGLVAGALELAEADGGNQ